MWNMSIPKRALFTIGTIAPALLFGVVIAMHSPISAAPTPLNIAKTSLTELAEPTTPDDSLAPSDNASTTQPTDHTGTPTDARSATSDGQDQTRPDADSDPAPPTDPPASVGATDAEVTDWSDAVPTDSLFSSGGVPQPTVVNYRYCIWTYSDGSTQQQVYQTKYATAPGAAIAISSISYASFDCTVATAP